MWLIRARRLVAGDGLIERPLVFANNDRPNVMLAGAVRAYVNQYAVVPRRERPYIFTNNDSAYATSA